MFLLLSSHSLFHKSLPLFEEVIPGLLWRNTWVLLVWIPLVCSILHLYILYIQYTYYRFYTISIIFDYSFINNNICYPLLNSTKWTSSTLSIFYMLFFVIHYCLMFLHLLNVAQWGRRKISQEFYIWSLIREIYVWPFFFSQIYLLNRSLYIAR